MQYRKFGKKDFSVSSLGFGCMRLPIIGSDYSRINEEESIKLLRKAIDSGINYIDTAYPYHSGSSEIVVGKALRDGYREKIKLATKSPVWLVESYQDFDKFLDEQLKKLQTEHVDMYLMHALDKERWENLQKLHFDKFIQNALADGRIGCAGFSFHDDNDTFMKIVDGFDWNFCQIQHNYLDEDYQAGSSGLKYASSKGMAVVIMEPLKGGKLSKKPPVEVQKIWDESGLCKKPAEWALSYLLNKKEVTTILSGMNTFEQLEENMATAEKYIPGSLSKKETETISLATNKYQELIKVDCTACGYCMPCPAGVNIPKNFEKYNEAFMYDNMDECLKDYKQMNEKSRSSSCVQCRRCEKICPQHIKISERLKEVTNTFNK